MAARLTLPAFLALAKSREWRTGEWDCMLACADWIRARTGIDPAEPWRGQYSDPASRTALLRREGIGLTRLAKRAVALAGLQPTDRPRLGDVGLIRVAWNDRQWRIAGISLGRENWWTASEGGKIVLALSVVSAWRVP